MTDNNPFRWVYFDVTPEHVALLPKLNIGWNGAAYHGAPGVDIKRPYGNSDVVRDIVEILGWPLIETRNGPEVTEEQAARALALHRQMERVLAIAVACNGVRPGRYKQREYGTAPWQPE
jgi:hypothetical protein